MTRTKAIMLLLFTLVPLAYIVLFMSPALDGVAFNVLSKLHLGMMGLYAILIIVYMRDVSQNAFILDGKKSLWIAIVFMGGPVGQLAYLWTYVLPHTEPRPLRNIS